MVGLGLGSGWAVVVGLGILGVVGRRWVSLVGCMGWRGANVKNMAAPISTQGVGSEVALRVEVSVISWAGAGVGVGVGCSCGVGHIGSGGASVGVVGCE